MFSVICPLILVFVVKLAIFLMFTVCGENTVKCLEDFHGKIHNLLALSILICSWKICNEITHEL